MGLTPHHSHQVAQPKQMQLRELGECKGNCGAGLNQFLAGGPKLIYYNKVVTSIDSPSRRS